MDASEIIEIEDDEVGECNAKDISKEDIIDIDSDTDNESQDDDPSKKQIKFPNTDDVIKALLKTIPRNEWNDEEVEKLRKKGCRIRKNKSRAKKKEDREKFILMNRENRSQLHALIKTKQKEALLRFGIIDEDPPERNPSKNKQLTETLPDVVAGEFF